MRVILHVDLDAFFPSVEARENPELKSKPLVVGADPKGGTGRGVVSSASYEARIFGVRSAMPISRAWKLCPDCVYLRPNFELYVAASNNIMKLLKSHSDKFEQGGIDEAYLDVSSKVENFDEAGDLARKIMDEILNQEHLSCSVGVGPNKIVAKIASDFRKPFGLTVVEEKDVKGFLFPLRVGKLPGVGPKTERSLMELKIETIGDLASTKPEALTRLFGVWGTRLQKFANGIDDREVMKNMRQNLSDGTILLRKIWTKNQKLLESWTDWQRRFMKMCKRAASNLRRSRLGSDIRILKRTPAPNP